MEKFTLEPTDKNILKSIEDNSFNRGKDISDFIKALDMIDGNAFISLDARWGEGKTFYVRQIEKTLEYFTKKQFGYFNESKDWENCFEKNVFLNKVCLEKSYLPLYYNAWLYDDHSDPLMSLIFCIAKQSQKNLDTQLESSKLLEKISSLMSAVQISVKNISASLDAEKVRNVFGGQDILSKIKTEEEIKQCVKDILEEIIVESAQRLIIFVDELDRCRPSFAIEMLERIKHYFDDDRIIFIVSLNKQQLIHTISNYYGVGFDSTAYLNKFFDYNIHLPLIDTQSIKHNLINDDREQYYLKNISEALCNYFKLSLRDILIFKRYISKLSSQWINDINARGCYLSLFVPIIITLDIVDEEEKVKFINGESDLLNTLAIEIREIRDLMIRFGRSGETEDEKFAEGLERFKNVYRYAFGNRNYDSYINYRLDINDDFKERCIQLTNGFIK